MHARRFATGTWLLIAVDAVSALGTGLVLPRRRLVRVGRRARHVVTAVGPKARRPVAAGLHRTTSGSCSMAASSPPDGAAADGCHQLHGWHATEACSAGDSSTRRDGLDAKNADYGRT